MVPSNADTVEPRHCRFCNRSGGSLRKASKIMVMHTENLKRNDRKRDTTSKRFNRHGGADKNERIFDITREIDNGLADTGTVKGQRLRINTQRRYGQTVGYQSEIRQADIVGRKSRKVEMLVSELSAVKRNLKDILKRALKRAKSQDGTGKYVKRDARGFGVHLPVSNEMKLQEMKTGCEVDLNRVVSTTPESDEPIVNFDNEEVSINGSKERHASLEHCEQKFRISLINPRLNGKSGACNSTVQSYDDDGYSNGTVFTNQVMEIYGKDFSTLMNAWKSLDQIVNSSYNCLPMVIQKNSSTRRAIEKREVVTNDYANDPRERGSNNEQSNYELDYPTKVVDQKRLFGSNDLEKMLKNCIDQYNYLMMKDGQNGYPVDLNKGVIQLPSNLDNTNISYPWYDIPTNQEILYESTEQEDPIRKSTEESDTLENATESNEIFKYNNIGNRISDSTDPIALNKELNFFKSYTTEGNFYNPNGIVEYPQMKNVMTRYPQNANYDRRKSNKSLGVVKNSLKPMYVLKNKFDKSERNFNEINKRKYFLKQSNADFSKGDKLYRGLNRSDVIMSDGVDVDSFKKCNGKEDIAALNISQLDSMIKFLLKQKSMNDAGNRGDGFIYREIQKHFSGCGGDKTVPILKVSGKNIWDANNFLRVYSNEVNKSGNSANDTLEDERTWPLNSIFRLNNAPKNIDKMVLISDCRNVLGKCLKNREKNNRKSGECRLAINCREKYSSKNISGDGCNTSTEKQLSLNLNARERLASKNDRDHISTTFRSNRLQTPHHGWFKKNTKQNKISKKERNHITTTAAANRENALSKIATEKSQHLKSSLEENIEATTTKTANENYITPSSKNTIKERQTSTETETMQYTTNKNDEHKLNTEISATSTISPEQIKISTVSQSDFNLTKDVVESSNVSKIANASSLVPSRDNSESSVTQKAVTNEISASSKSDQNTENQGKVDNGNGNSTLKSGNDLSMKFKSTSDPLSKDVIESSSNRGDDQRAVLNNASEMNPVLQNDNAQGYSVHNTELNRTKGFGKPEENGSYLRGYSRKPYGPFRLPDNGSDSNGFPRNYHENIPARLEEASRKLLPEGDNSTRDITQNDLNGDNTKNELEELTKDTKKRKHEKESRNDPTKQELFKVKDPVGLKDANLLGDTDSQGRLTWRSIFGNGFFSLPCAWGKNAGKELPLRAFFTRYKKPRSVVKVPQGYIEEKLLKRFKRRADVDGYSVALEIQATSEVNEIQEYNRNEGDNADSLLKQISSQSSEEIPETAWTDQINTDDYQAFQTYNDEHYEESDSSETVQGNNLLGEPVPDNATPALLIPTAGYPTNESFTQENGSTIVAKSIDSESPGNQSETITTKTVAKWNLDRDNMTVWESLGEGWEQMKYNDVFLITLSALLVLLVSLLTCWVRCIFKARKASLRRRLVNSNHPDADRSKNFCKCIACNIEPANEPSFRIELDDEKDLMIERRNFMAFRVASVDMNRERSSSNAGVVERRMAVSAVSAVSTISAASATTVNRDAMLMKTRMRADDPKNLDLMLTMRETAQEAIRPVPASSHRLEIRMKRSDVAGSSKLFENGEVRETSIKIIDGTQAIRQKSNKTFWRALIPRRKDKSTTQSETHPVLSTSKARFKQKSESVSSRPLKDSTVKNASNIQKSSDTVKSNGKFSTKQVSTSADKWSRKQPNENDSLSGKRVRNPTNHRNVRSRNLRGQSSDESGNRSKDVLSCQSSASEDRDSRKRTREKIQMKDFGNASQKGDRESITLHEEDYGNGLKNEREDAEEVGVADSKKTIVLKAAVHGNKKDGRLLTNSGQAKVSRFKKGMSRGCEVNAFMKNPTKSSDSDSDIAKVMKDSKCMKSNFKHMAISRLAVAGSNLSCNRSFESFFPAVQEGANENVKAGDDALTRPPENGDHSNSIKRNRDASTRNDKLQIRRSDSEITCTSRIPRRVNMDYLCTKTIKRTNYFERFRNSTPPQQDNAKKSRLPVPKSNVKRSKW